MNAQVVARQLFAAPGAVSEHTRHLLAQAAGLHARLLDSAAAARHEELGGLRTALSDYLRCSAGPTEKRWVLDDPQFIEALHELAAGSEVLGAWDATVAGGCSRGPDERQASHGRGRLGNVATGVLLRQRRDWCGQIELATDAYGRIHLPFCDWVLVLIEEHRRGRTLLADHAVVLRLDMHEAQWSLMDPQSPPLVRMPRRTFDAMFVDNKAAAPWADLQFGSLSPWPRFERASRLGNTQIRFEPIAGDAPSAHAELTGGIVATLLTAIERNASHIFDQLCQCIRTIQGFELPPYGGGQIASFSVPTSPGIIGFNVQFTSRDEPRLDPYCFMWLGHELGHTMHYLIDDVAYLHGWRFLENPATTTPTIPRYGRSLAVRTVFQLPFVHLFEWWLLMLFYERGFAGLPWQMFEETVSVGNDLSQEIDEAFELIDQHAQLTVLGQAVVERLRELVAEAVSHWRALSTAIVKRSRRRRKLA